VIVVSKFPEPWPLPLPMKIISGGQTGVDRGALDAAIASGVPHGGWCPCGRLAEDGRIPDRYELRQTDSPDYPVRTERNVLDSDATLILYSERISGGTELTLQLARRHCKPCMTVDLDDPQQPEDITRWLDANSVSVLNVAGPRESQTPGIASAACEFVTRIIRCT